MSLRITTQPLRRRIAAASCRLCASVDSTTTAAAAARQQWQTTRPFSFHNKPSIHHQRVGNALPFFHRFASTAATASRPSTGDGPTVNIPEFPTHANRPPVGGGLEKQEIQGTAPSFDALKADEEWGEDTELVSPEEAKIYITGPALTQLVKIASREPDWNPARPHLALRLAVESGGCHGYQYEMKLEELVGTSSSEGGKAANVDDYVFNVVGPKGEPAVPVVIDLISLGLLKGSTLHFATELIGSAFGIKDNPQAKEAGSCGCGISWEAK